MPLSHDEIGDMTKTAILTPLEEALSILITALERQFAQKQFVELRGITDTANHNAAVDFKVNLATEMANLAKLLVRWQTSASR